MRVSCAFWGNFQPGPASMSPLSHGPYFVIYSTHPHPEELFTNMPMTLMEYILVPYPELAAILREKLQQLVDRGLLSEEKRDSFVVKIVDYKQFLEKMESKVIPLIDKRQTEAPSGHRSKRAKSAAPPA